MSSSFPPPPPPPPANGPPGGPPSGPPEYLDSGAGAPAPSAGGGGGVKKGIFLGGGVLGLAAVGVGAWAAYSFMATGAQPAEALPADTLGYVSIDLDPSGGQKIEALRTLNKFPAFEDQVGIDSDDDIRELLFDKIQEDAKCEGLDYADDIEPWLGDRAAVAAVDTGADEPDPVFVVQVKDADAAEAGLDAIKACGSGDDEGGWAVVGDWVVIAETDAIADDVVEATDDGTLADNEDFQRWTAEAGDAGIMTMYAGPAVGDYLADHPDFLNGAGAAASDLAGSAGSGAEVPAELTDKLRDFQGAAATVRFSDGAVELEAAGDGSVAGSGLLSSGGTADVVSSLPADTVATFGLGFADGWFGDLIDQVAPYTGQSSEELLEMLSAQTGLDLPDDAEALAGDSAAIVVGSGFDPEEFFSSPDGSGIPVAVKIDGDAEAVEGVLSKLTDMLGSTGEFLGVSKDDDTVVIGPDSGYRDDVLADGGLGDNEVFQGVVRESDQASTVLFVNVDEIQSALEGFGMGEDDAEVFDNVEPLAGFGMTAWVDDDVAHTVIRLTTD